MKTAEQLLARILFNSEHPTASYEDAAELFFRETGLMAPGKAEPLGYYTEEQQAERRKRWDEWTKARRIAWQQEVRAVLGDAVEDHCENGLCGSCSKCMARENEE